MASSCNNWKRENGSVMEERVSYPNRESWVGGVTRASFWKGTLIVNYSRLGCSTWTPSHSSVYKTTCWCGSHFGQGRVSALYGAAVLQRYGATAADVAVPIKVMFSISTEIMDVSQYV